MRAWTKFIGNALSLTTQTQSRSQVPSSSLPPTIQCFFHARSGKAEAEEEQSAPCPSLRAELRRLFKLVHPDLFHSHPHAQVVNQQSFQLLQQYLNAAKGVSSPEQHIYHFVFYLHNDTANKKLEKVEVSLPRPQVRYLSPNRAEILPVTRAALGHLLFACGLSRHVKGGLLSEEEDQRLSDLFQQASETQRQNETSLLVMEQKLVVVKNALCMGRGIRVSFVAALAGLPPKEQIALLHRLGKALDQSKEVNFLGHSVLIGDCYGVDNLGNLWLNHEDTADKWFAFLNTADLVTALKYKREVTLRRALEFKVAKLMEIEMIFTNDSLSIHPRYSQFLNEMAEGALQHGAVGGGNFYELPVKVTGSPQELEHYEEEKRQSTTTFEVDGTMGYVAVPVWENPTNLYSFIEQHGETALASRQRFKQLEEQLEEMKKRARKQLKLRHLTFDNGLSRDKCLSACTRLLRNAQELTRYTEGLSICLSHENELPQPGSKRPVCLKWNFSISDL